MLFLTAAAIFILDRITKYMAVDHLAEGRSLKVVPNIFHLTLVRNPGAAFGLLRGATTLFIALSVLIAVFIVIYAFRRKTDDAMMSTALGLILGGAGGNLLDRIRLGYVIDFLDFRIWPVFNVADSAITIGAMILVLRILFQKHKARI